MLDFMRRRARSTWIKVIFLIIVLVFIFWGFGGSLAGRSTADGIATVGGQAISLKEFQRAYENLKAAYREAYKDRLTPEMLQALNLKQQTLDQLINAKLVRQEARRIGFTVDDNELRDSIKAISIFQAEGQFSQAQYLRVLSILRMTPGEFEEEQRGDLLQKKLQHLISDAVPATDEEAQELFRLANEQVNLSFVKIASAELLNEIAVDKKEAEEYYNTRRESFRQPERVRFVYVAYPPAHFEAKVQISAQEEEEFYNDHKTERFTLPARVHARHILFTVSSDAKDDEKAKIRETAVGVLARARAGEDFATLAKTYSQDTGTAPKGGDLGFFSRGRMVKPFEEAAFNLSAGGISDLVESPFGYHIIKAEAVEQETVRKLDEVRGEIHQELVHARAQELAHGQAEEDQKKIQNGAKLTDIAQAEGLKVVETPLVSRDETLPDLGRQLELNLAALTLAVDQVSAPVQVGDSWYLVSPREKVDSKIPDFAAVAEEAEKRARSEKAEQLAKTKADALLAKAKESKDLTTVARQDHLKVEETGPFSRQGTYIPKMGNLPDLKKEAFRLTPESPLAPQTYVWGGNAFVAMLKEQPPPAMADFEKQKDRLRNDLGQRKQAAAFQEFLNTLKKRATIAVDPSALQKLPL